MPREKAAMIILRKQGVSINTIAQFLGRSRSIIHKTLKANYLFGLRKIELRKLPNHIRVNDSRKNRSLMEQLRLKWENFILGSEAKPP